MTKAETAALATMTPEQLIEGFVHETKLYQLSDVPKANKALEKKIAFGNEIARRGGHSSLETLMANPDPFVAYSAAAALVKITEFRERALTVLDRIADACIGTASTRARIARNVIRYGDYRGDPVQYEKELAESVARSRERATEWEAHVRARDNRA